MAAYTRLPFVRRRCAESADRRAVIADLLGMRLVLGGAAIVLASRVRGRCGLRAIARRGNVPGERRARALERPPDPCCPTGREPAVGLGYGHRPLPPGHHSGPGARVRVGRSWLARLSCGSDSDHPRGRRLDDVPCPQRGRAGALFRTSRWRPLLRDVVPYALATAAGLLYFRVAVVLMSLVSTERETGLYSAAFRIVEVLMIVPQLAVGALLPILARAASDDHDRLAYGVDRSFPRRRGLRMWPCRRPRNRSPVRHRRRRRARLRGSGRHAPSPGPRPRSRAGDVRLYVCTPQPSPAPRAPPRKRNGARGQHCSDACSRPRLGWNGRGYRRGRRRAVPGGGAVWLLVRRSPAWNRRGRSCRASWPPGSRPRPSPSSPVYRTSSSRSPESSSTSPLPSLCTSFPRRYSQSSGASVSLAARGRSSRASPERSAPT